VVKRAAALCDPKGADEEVAALVARFEDDDRPARPLGDLGWQAGSERGGGTPAGAMTLAAATWLATNWDRRDDREVVLREAARAAYGGQPPSEIEGWLAGTGVSL
jgi:hypothetical protein